MKLLLVIAWLGNLIDLIATLYLTQLGYTEVNSIMRWLLLQHPFSFVWVKLLLMTAVLKYLWRYRKDKHAKPLALLAAVVYGAISVYYGVFFTLLL